MPDLSKYPDFSKSPEHAYRPPAGPAQRIAQATPYPAPCACCKRRPASRTFQTTFCLECAVLIDGGALIQVSVTSNGAIWHMRCRNCALLFPVEGEFDEAADAGKCAHCYRTQTVGQSLSLAQPDPNPAASVISVPSTNGNESEGDGQRSGARAPQKTATDSRKPLAPKQEGRGPRAPLALAGNVVSGFPEDDPPPGSSSSEDDGHGRPPPRIPGRVARSVASMSLDENRSQVAEGSSQTRIPRLHGLKDLPEFTAMRGVGAHDKLRTGIEAFMALNANELAQLRTPETLADTYMWLIITMCKHQQAWSFLRDHFRDMISLCPLLATQSRSHVAFGC